MERDLWGLCHQDTRSGDNPEGFYLLGVIVVIGVVGLRAEHGTIAHRQFLRTALEKNKNKK